MSDTNPNIELKKGELVNLYTVSGIPVGTQLVCQNIGGDSVQLTTKATEPLDTDGFEVLPRNSFGVNEVGSSGEWARSVNVSGLINVRIA